jgi:1-acyl-sn-glycerol-3-phosphate acyltransferase
MEQLAALSGQEYIGDTYAADVKKSLEAGQGYPEGAEPGKGRIHGTKPKPKFLRYRL